MRQETKFIVLGLAAMSLTACAGLELQNAKMAQPSGSAFSMALYEGYVQLSENEYDEGDYFDSDVFAMRAVASTGGNVPQPEAIDARDLPADSVGDLADARTSLMSVLDADAADKWPDLAADAQVMFDCWMQEQEENRQPEDIAACRRGFENAMVQIRAKMKPVAMPAPEPAPMPDPVAALPGPFAVPFDFDSSSINTAGASIINEAAQGFAAAGAGRISLRGHTDSSGDNRYNATLSKARANAVKEALVAKGVPADAISAIFFGERKQAEPTGDGVRSQANRRVEIVIGR